MTSHARQQQADTRGNAHDGNGGVDQIYCYRQGAKRHLIRVSCGIEKCDHHVARPRHRSGCFRLVAESLWRTRS